MTALLSDREILACLEKIGGGDAARGLGILCVAARTCPACGTSWANPDYACGCTDGRAGGS